MEAGERSGWGDWREGVGEGSQEGVCGYVQSAECGAECGVQGAWGSLCVCVWQPLRVPASQSLRDGRFMVDAEEHTPAFGTLILRV